ncbi:uncharacterized protein PV09_05887 [Verruconis gallopava]|uniref:DUF4110 domain-containing protein n=1 Tax=Verruconis gallopava TaxID=253628 RepID=A0A0D2A8A6_9PEZI|nr:uncharacterized protein PV09_05887 [Verruconis gallopava]KIW02830.1 hypothetical protein PV09_05887 [Verruconis gallopava]
MAKKDKKSKEAEKKARKAKSQEKKSAKTDKKLKVKGKLDEDSDVEDVDLDAVLAEYARQQEQFLKVTETVSEPPTPRGSATLIGSPSNDNELFLFGGEYFNGALATFYNDLFIYNINRDEWRKVTSPNSPLPRSGHAWCRGGNAGGIYLFGGEFSSPKQGTFYHYNDFWRLDPSSREWTRLEGKGKGPPARSGHRLTYFKNYIILFGGFQDTSQSTKYLNDLWIYDCNTFTWHEPKLPPATGKPDPRSSFTLLPHENGAVLFGGYSRVKTTVNAGNKGIKGGTRVTSKPVIHQDTWFLRITPPASEAPPGSLPAVRWERRKRPANAPNPTRAGATMCLHKGRGIQFGGVHDVEESEEGIESEFFNEMFAWNVERNRFFPLALRRPRAAPKRAAPERSRRERGRQAEEDLLANLRNLEMKAGAAQEDIETSKAAAEDDGDERPEKPVMFEMPNPRFNAQLAVQGDTLFLYGGTFEKGDREYTFDEMWAIDLGKLDGVREIFKRELEDWQGSESGESDDDEDDEEDEDEDADDELNGNEVTEARTATNEVSTSTSQLSGQEEDETEEITERNDGLPYPRPFETLRDFYARTSVQWQEIIMAEPGNQNSDAQSVKEVRKKAFDRAEDKWWDCREEIRALEDEQIEAGIGDVVSLAEKAQAGPGAGRRR